MQLEDGGGEVVGEGMFGGRRQGLVVFWKDEEYLVAIGTEPEARY